MAAVPRGRDQRTGRHRRWTVTAAREIVDPQAGKCLDVTGNNPADGIRLQIRTCTGGAHQRWTVG